MTHPQALLMVHWQEQSLAHIGHRKHDTAQLYYTDSTSPDVLHPARLHTDNKEFS
jgi:hypothetical protein